jgi:hypothetical protein
MRIKVEAVELPRAEIDSVHPRSRTEIMSDRTSADTLAPLEESFE